MNTGDNTAECNACGERFAVPAGRGAPRKYCGEQCRARVRRERQRIAKRQCYQPTQKKCVCAHCGKGFETFHKRKYCTKRCGQLATQRRKQRPKECECCGVWFSNLTRHPQRTCSEECRYELRLASWNRQNAKRRGCESVGEKFNPQEIFARDKWRCKCCGVHTPKHLRGTSAPNAPELDHILPISAGGTHTRVNTQLLCKQCNKDKGAGAAYDQHLLFG